MSQSNLSRRTFLSSASAGMVGTLLAKLASSQQRFSDDLDEARAGPSTDLFSRLHTMYSLDPGVTYLNHASIGTVPLVLQRAHRRYLELCERNPWLYMWGGAWEKPREQVRSKAASLLGCSNNEVTFSHNTTETFNLLAQGLPLGANDEVLMSSLNHTGASACWEHAANERGYRVKRFEFPALQTPQLTVDDVVALYDEHITAKTRALILPHVDNTVGLRHPLRAIADRARQRGVRYIAVDAAQTVGMIPVDVEQLNVDVYATSAHKWLQAPKGLGLAYVNQRIQEELRPFWVTWGQRSWQGTARAFEDYGTRNLAEVLTLGDAIDFHHALGETEKTTHHRRLWQHAQTQVAEHDSLRWRSPVTWDLAAALYAIEVREQDSRQLAEQLFAEHGFVFRPFNLDGVNTIRLSPNVANTTADIDRLIERLS